MTAAVVTGQYVAPGAGKITLKEYAETWRANQAHRPTTQEQVERQFKLHVYPHLGDRPLATILPSDLRALVVFDQGFTGTFGSNMSGTGTLKKQGGGLLVLTGTNTDTGGTIVNGGTLMVNSNSLPGNVLSETSSEGGAVDVSGAARLRINTGRRLTGAPNSI